MARETSQADTLAADGRIDEAIAAAGEAPEPALCLSVARAYERLGEGASALRWALTATDRADDFMTWQAAAGIARRTARAGPEPKRAARLALLGSYTTSQF